MQAINKASVAGLMGLCGLLLQAPAIAGDKALIVGVGKFQEPRYNLPGIELDVDMAVQLAQHMGIRQENIRVIRDNKATIAGMRSSLEWVAQDVGTNDQVFIYVSSHGSQVKDRSGDEKDGLDETLFIHDGHFIDDDFNALLTRIPSKNVVVVVDACHSGTGTKSFSGANTYRVSDGVVKSVPGPAPVFGQSVGNKSVVVEAGQTAQDSNDYLALAAAQDNQQSIATPKGSLFTLALLDSFESARSDSRNITWKQLYEETKSKIVGSGYNFVPNMDGSTTLAQRAVRFAAPATGGAGVAQSPVWQSTVEAAGRGARLNISSPESFRDQDLLGFSVEVPVAGYLNIISIGPDDQATLLFPNKFQPNNRVQAGSISFPTDKSYRLRAVAPFGKTLIAAFVTTEPVNLLEVSMGNKDSNGNLTAPFGSMMGASIRDKLTRSIRIEPAGELPKLYSGTKVVNITPRN